MAALEVPQAWVGPGNPAVDQPQSLVEEEVVHREQQGSLGERILPARRSLPGTAEGEQEAQRVVGVAGSKAAEGDAVAEEAGRSGNSVLEAQKCQARPGLGLRACHPRLSWLRARWALAR